MRGERKRERESEREEKKEKKKWNIRTECGHSIPHAAAPTSLHGGYLGPRGVLRLSRSMRHRRPSEPQKLSGISQPVNATSPSHFLDQKLRYLLVTASIALRRPRARLAARYTYGTHVSLGPTRLR